MSTDNLNYTEIIDMLHLKL